MPNLSKNDSRLSWRPVCQLWTILRKKDGSSESPRSGLSKKYIKRWSRVWLQRAFRCRRPRCESRSPAAFRTSGVSSRLQSQTVECFLKLRSLPGTSHYLLLQSTIPIKIEPKSASKDSAVSRELSKYQFIQEEQKEYSATVLRRPSIITAIQDMP
jgi:hypothetical protein